MRLTLIALTVLALAFAPAPPNAPTTIALAQPAAPAASAAQVQIVDPGASHLVVFSVVYTLTVTWPTTTTVTTTTTVPSYLIVASAPGCSRIGNRIGCSAEVQADQAAAVVLRFAVPWDVRGQVDLSSVVVDADGAEATAGASFVVPPQNRLPIVLR